MHKKYLPTDYEGRKGRLFEEMGEVLQILGKIDRFGLYSSNPLLPVEDREENWRALIRELDDLEDAIDDIRRDLKPQIKALPQARITNWDKDDWDPQP